MAFLGDLLIRLKAETADFQQDMGKAAHLAEKSAKQISRAFDGLKGLLASIGLGVGLHEIVSAVSEAEQASNRLTAVLRAAGQQAGLTKQDLDDLAESMAASTQFDDESIRNAESALLKFGNIYGEVFKESLKLSADLAAFLGTNIPEAAQMLGKTVQSPTEGLKMMERQFGKLTASEKEHIEMLARQGKAIEAQNAVLDLWRQKIGGTADLMNSGMLQATRDVSKSWNEMLEAFGKTSLIGGTIMKVLGGVKTLLDDIRTASEPFGREDKLREGAERLRDLQEEIEGLREELDRPDAGGGIANIEQLQNRLAAASKEAVMLAQQLTVLQRGGREEAPEQGEVILGGGNAGAMSKDEILKRQLQSMEDFDEEVRKGNVELNKFLDQLKEKNIEDWGTMWKQVWEEYDADQERAIQQSKEFLDAQRALADQAQEQKKLANDLGFTFASAFEDAIVEGKKLREVLQGLYQDILRILTRRLFTEPLAAGITGAISGGIFSGGGGIAGGPIASAAGPGVNINNTYNIDSRTDRASIVQAVEAGNKRTKAEISDMMYRGDRRMRPA